MGTEFGLYFSVNGGEQWVKLSGGLPTISFRDLAIHKRENDLVGATFGRGFYVLDDYSLLRDIDADVRFGSSGRIFQDSNGVSEGNKGLSVAPVLAHGHSRIVEMRGGFEVVRSGHHDGCVCVRVVL